MKRDLGPLEVRKLLGLPADTLGKMLGYYTGRAYRRQTIYAWERPERGVKLAERYAMTDAAREGYRRLLADLVSAVSGGRYALTGELGARRWRFQLQAKCRACGRPFVVRRRTAVRCARCIGKGKR